jgi:hypothetical protein
MAAAARKKTSGSPNSDCCGSWLSMFVSKNYRVPALHLSLLYPYLEWKLEMLDMIHITAIWCPLSRAAVLPLELKLSLAVRA